VTDAMQQNGVAEVARPAVLKLSIKGPVFSPAARLANGLKPISAKSCASRNTKFPSSKSAGPSAPLPANSVLVSVPEPWNSVPKSSVKIGARARKSRHAADAKGGLREVC